MKPALGKGLNALIPDSGAGVREIDVSKIKPGPEQPRKDFDEKALKELAQSIREKGLLQPVILRKAEGGGYYLVAGERRWRAARSAGLKKIPAIIKDVDSSTAIELALIENIQRDDLNPVEMAEAFQRLIDEYGYTQEQLSKRLGKERATIANYLRILKLPIEIRDLIVKGELSLGHAKALLSVPTRSLQIQLAREIIKKGLSVREAEQLCSRKKPSRTTKKKKEKDPNIVALEERLKQSLGTKVQINHKGKRGKIEIEYYSLDELDRLLEILLSD
ncbi:MAG: ParB/RepB/Spo0J family partition protein [Nitrospirae bacterium]|nr:ParB/RepB/Spo0J family partition protein [Nitrospirota bacterium]